MRPQRASPLLLRANWGLITEYARLVHTLLRCLAQVVCSGDGPSAEMHPRSLSACGASATSRHRGLRPISRRGVEARGLWHTAKRRGSSVGAEGQALGMCRAWNLWYGRRRTRRPVPMAPARCPLAIIGRSQVGGPGKMRMQAPHKDGVNCRPHFPRKYCTTAHGVDQCGQHVVLRFATNAWALTRRTLGQTLLWHSRTRPPRPVCPGQIPVFRALHRYLWPHHG